jgi:hexosaminidase
MNTIIPKPVTARPAAGTFTITAATQITIQPASEELHAIGNYLADRLRPATGYALPVLDASAAPAEQITLTTAGDDPVAEQITLTTAGDDPTLGEEGYELIITHYCVNICAAARAGLF